MICQILFPGTNKKNISKCHLLKIIPRMLKGQAKDVFQLYYGDNKGSDLCIFIGAFVVRQCISQFVVILQCMCRFILAVVMFAENTLDILTSELFTIL